jgi:hypothetical protein
MTKQERYALLAALMRKLKERGSWCGETHVQKAVYVAQELLAVDFGYNYRLYKHGPYSFDLSDELAAMRADDAIRLCPQAYPYGPTLEPTERGEELLASSQAVEEYAPCLTLIGDWFGSKDVKYLERLATGYLVTRELPLGSAPDIRAERLHKLKPHIPRPLAFEAIREVDQLMAASETLQPN